jgi:hypothetical protein
MKNLKISILFLFILMLALSSCSKKGADKIIGKWKIDKIEEMEKMGISLNLTYEFTIDKMIIEGSIIGKIDGRDTTMIQPKVEVSFIVKSDDGVNIVIEATHPQTKEKGEFKLKLDKDKMVMTDPKQAVLNLTKI